MAGAGYKLFQTGDVLTAAQVNTYLNEQTVMVFASAAARTSALTSVLAEGMVSYLQDTNAVEVYNGSAWVGVSGAGDVTEVQAGVGISVASGTGPIPIVTNTVATAFDAAGDLVYGTGADTFTKLSLGTAGQVLKVNSGATAPEWGAASGASSFVGCSLYKSGNQSISTATSTLITWDSEDFDTDAFHSTATNTDRITIPSGKDGKYLFVWALEYVNNGTGQRSASLLKNGSLANYAVIAANNNANIKMMASYVASAVATDYFSIQTYQDAGTSQNVLGTAGYSAFQAYYLGA